MPRPTRYREINVVCMSGQGSVQAVQILGRLYHRQHGMYINTHIIAGGRSKGGPTVSMVKLADQPIVTISRNFEPNDVIVMWDGLIRVAAAGSHDGVLDAIGWLQRGNLIVATDRPPELIPLPFKFQGTVATVDAWEIGRRVLKKDPPPMGAMLLGALARLSGDMDLDILEDEIVAQFEKYAGDIKHRNVDAMRECYDKLQILTDVVSPSERLPDDEWTGAANPEELPAYWTLRTTAGERLGFRQGSPNVWRTRIPVCDDGKCACKAMCLSEVTCPDTAGYLIRNGVPHQGYRIDVDFCKGCGLCADVCVFSAIQMVPEFQVMKTNPNYDDITVEPHFPSIAERVARLQAGVA